MSEESLDNFVSNTTNQSTPMGDGVVRPKLRKIKRPKVKVVNSMPQAPKKENPIPEHDEEIVLEKNDEQIGTSLVTAIEAQELALEKEAESQYAFNNNSPELNYDDDDDFIVDAEYAGYVKKNVLIIASVVCLVLGMFIGKALFSSRKVEKHGLEGVVINQDVPQGRPRCGLTDKSQACVFYLMNWYKQELNGRDFYKLAAQLTGREEYMIETDNLRYATVKIKPGHFAQLNIPALK